MTDAATQPPFRIGLAMAGAVSAGAYTAGVLDFLVEALDEWTAAKARGEAVPMHAVSLDVAAGASAGSMCAALLAVLLPYRFPHVQVGGDGTASVVGNPAQPPSGNPLYKAWVEDIGIDKLLETGDLDPGRVDALLNCRVIDDILKDSLRYAATPAARPWVAKPFVARFTLGNLRGVPYAIGFRGGSQERLDAMREHADWRGFRIGDPNPPPPDTANLLHAHRALPACSLEDAAGWDALGLAALASGAFPLALRPRVIEAAGADYAMRHFVAARPDRPAQPIPPAWDRQQVPAEFPFWSVDGGVFDNEPFQLAHEIVAGGRCVSNPRDSKNAEAAVLMIAPFFATPDNGERPLPDKQGAFHLPLWTQLTGLLNARTQQARFKPADLALAYDDSIYSRYVIAPSKSAAPESAWHWIASGGLGGFMGFFSEEFRKHDYQLGRRNCQRFLAEWFTIPADNTLLAAGYAQLDAAARQPFLSEDGALQIVPLMPRLRAEEPKVRWPAGQFDPAQVLPAVGARLDAIFPILRDEALEKLIPNRIGRALARPALNAAWSLLLRRKLCQAIEGQLRAALETDAL